MFEKILYGVGFFLITLLIQYLLSNRRKNRNDKSYFWVGSNTIVVICVMGIVLKDINYLAAVIGFVFADDIGKSKGWH